MNRLSAAFGPEMEGTGEATGTCLKWLDRLSRQTENAPNGVREMLRPGERKILALALTECRAQVILGRAEQSEQEPIVASEYVVARSRSEDDAIVFFLPSAPETEIRCLDGIPPGPGKDSLRWLDELLEILAKRPAVVRMELVRPEKNFLGQALRMVREKVLAREDAEVSSK